MMAFSPMVVKLQIAPDKGMLAVGPMVATLPLAPERGMISFGPITVKLQAAQTKVRWCLVRWYVEKLESAPEKV